LSLWVVLLCVAVPRLAQAEEAWLEERESFLERRKLLMIGLAGWAAASIGAGTALMFVDPPGAARDPASRAERRGFAAISLVYGVINAALAASTLATIPSLRSSLDSAEDVHAQRRRSADTFTANVGLDMIYVLVGAGLATRAPSPVARGVGVGFVVQGAPLVAFDILGSELYRR
jgi:hypothetical protein